MAPDQTQPPDDLFDLVTHGREERNIEYKAFMSWDSDPVKAKVVKACLAMSNIPDGGWLVFGEKEKDRGVFEAIGMSQEDAQSFNQDDIQAYVNEYADPHIEPKVYHRRYKFGNEERIFILIRIPQFDQVPIICKKDGKEGLNKGTVYTRSRRMPESAPVRDQTEMREILDMAVDKQMRSFLTRMDGWGLLRAEGPPEDPDAAAFRSERKDLEEHE